MQFIRCRTCGRYLPAEAAVGERYCSQECSLEYASCQNCGGYFLASTGHEGRYCSQECSVQYRLRPLGGRSEENT